MWPLPEIADELARKNLIVWLDLLETWNARLDLTAAKTRPEIVHLMIDDALVLAPHVRRGAKVVDVGTGAGAPGLALAIIRPDLDVTLVEPLGKRASFLRTVIGSIERPNLHLLQARGEALEKKQFDEAISRATLSPEEWLALGSSLARERVWLLLAKEAAPEGTIETTEDYGSEGKSRRAIAYKALPQVG